jgi:hypothetical protein
VLGRGEVTGGWKHCTMKSCSSDIARIMTKGIKRARNVVSIETLKYAYTILEH